MIGDDAADSHVDVTAVLKKNGATVVVDDGVSHPENYVTKLEDLHLPFLEYLLDVPDTRNQFRPMGAKKQMILSKVI